MPGPRDRGKHVLPVAEEVWGSEPGRGQTAESLGGRERKAQESGGGPGFGHPTDRDPISKSDLSLPCFHDKLSSL